MPPGSRSSPSRTPWGSPSPGHLRDVGIRSARSTWTPPPSFGGSNPLDWHELLAAEPSIPAGQRLFLRYVLQDKTQPETRQRGRDGWSRGRSNPPDLEDLEAISQSRSAAQENGHQALTMFVDATTLISSADPFQVDLVYEVDGLGEKHGRRGSLSTPQRPSGRRSAATRVDSETGRAMGSERDHGRQQLPKT